ncbi:MAG: polysaccharide biosynthesis protein [Ferruginibacter sp.]|nr:polysaccharide biosynthesis protein [Ferruginibacter sp.]
MFNIEKFISKNITKRETSFFDNDIINNSHTLTQEIEGKSVLVIGGAGTIGSSYIKAILEFNPAIVYVVDINENGLTELVRDVRSNGNFKNTINIITYPIDFDSPVFYKLFKNNNGFDIVANFAAHKHVRSEKDAYSIEAMIENNVLKAKKFLDLLVAYPPKHFFCVSTDKAANPVNLMGASKKLMEEVIMAYSDKFKVTTARFANVAFSNGSLLFGFIERMAKQQPLAAPSDIKRYFVSPKESGQLCMLACILGKTTEIFFPKLAEDDMQTFSSIANNFLAAYNLLPDYCQTENEAKENALLLKDSDTKYPVYYFTSDTDGEKSFEEFFTVNEKLDNDRFINLGVVTDYPKKTMESLSTVLNDIETLFKKESITKDEIIATLKTIIPNFSHINTGKSLDNKM